MKLLVLINSIAAGANAEATRQHVADAFAVAGVPQAEVRVVDPRDLAQHASDATRSDIDAIIAGGDDRTVAAVMEAIGESDKAVGTLPMHELRGEQIDAAVAALARGTILERTVGEANGRPFLNVAAVGLGAPADPAWLALLRRAKVLPSRELCIRARGHTFVDHTPCVVVSSDEAKLRAMGITPSQRAHHFQLSAYVAVGRRRRKRFEPMPLPDFRVDARQKKVEVLIDGRRVEMATPVRFKLRDKPLRVLVPAPSATTNSSPPPAGAGDAT